MKSFADSPHFEPGAREVSLVALGLLVLISCSASWLCVHGYLLYYGDAQAHLNISRSIIDSRTPGYDQLGTVWLPMLHLICLPFVRVDSLWQSGLAGTIPVAACFAVAGVFIYLTAFAVYATRTAALSTLACFALNPNVLYLACIPMTEVVFAAGVSVLVWSLVRFRRQGRWKYLAIGFAAVAGLVLTRYDGWFLMPFAAMAFGWAQPCGRVKRAVVFLALSCAAPASWLIHNWYLTGNALDFFNGPYSAKAIQGGRPYPGLHHWPLALLQYVAAGLLCCGFPLLVLGILGSVVAVRQRSFEVIGFLCLTPLFYVWSIHSSGTPVFVPTLYPFGYYNTRYGLALVLPASFAVGALVGTMKRSAWLLPALAVLPWVTHPAADDWICWRESQINSMARRHWTGEAARFLRDHYHSGEGILTSFGDVTGIYGCAGIPLREVVHIGNGAWWLSTTVRPELLPQEAWAVSQDGDQLGQALQKDRRRTYTLTYKIDVKGAPSLNIYRRTLADDPSPAASSQ